jgi:hypothetical protein
MDLGFPPMISTGSRRNGWPLLLKIEAAQEKKLDGEKRARAAARRDLRFTKGSAFISR